MFTEPHIHKMETTPKSVSEEVLNAPQPHTKAKTRAWHATTQAKNRHIQEKPKKKGGTQHESYLYNMSPQRVCK